MRTLQRSWAIGFIALLIASWKLWSPATLQPDASYYPDIAVTGWLGGLQPIIDVIALPAMITISLAIAWKPHRALWVILATLLAISFGTDQHRLQPWAYQTFLYGIVFACQRDASSRRFILPIAISVYAFSAIGKLDFQFLHSVGQDFLQPITRLADISLNDVSMQTRVVLAGLFPFSELTIAFLLAIPKSRRFAGYLAILMHVSLILLLSPLGQNHSWGVLIWNAVLIAQAWLLFCQMPCTLTPSERTVDVPLPKSNRWEFPNFLAALVTIAACTLPLVERSGRWDHWLSWALYSPHSSRLDVQVHSSVLDEIPDSIKNAIGDDQDGDHWHDFDLSQWSLISRGVPVYPQARYQLGLTNQLASQMQWSDEIRGILKTASDRRSGDRDTTFLRTAEEMKKAASRYWLLP